MIAYYWITGINPEPWVAPEGALGRRNGKIFIQFHKSAGLASYQLAVAEEIILQNGHLPDSPLDEDLQVTFWLWRELGQAETTRKTNRNVADATNMQKALEDALQGVLYKNDKRNHDVRTIIVEQSASTLPNILIEVRSGEDRTTPGYPVPLPSYGKHTPDTLAPDNLF